MERMWSVATAASDAFSKWANAVAAVDTRFAAGFEQGLPLVLAAQATFRSQARAWSPSSPWAAACHCQCRRRPHREQCSRFSCSSFCT